jgi:hypothetical protein
MIKYQTKKDAADPNNKFTRSFYAEHFGIPSNEMVKKLVEQISKGDFNEKSIEIQEILGFDPKKIKGIELHRFK